MMYYDFILSDFREIVINSLTTLFWYNKVILKTENYLLHSQSKHAASLSRAEPVGTNERTYRFGKERARVPRDFLLEYFLSDCKRKKKMYSRLIKPLRTTLTR